MSYGRWTRALFEAAASMANVARSARALRTFLNFSFLLHPSVHPLLLITRTSSFVLQPEKLNPMKHPSLLLTAALSLAAASAYAQAAKSSPAAGASASPSTPPTIASAIDREISCCREGSRRSGRGDAGGQVRFFSGKAEHFRQRLQRCAHIWRASEAYRRVQLSHLVADYRRETTGHGQRRQRPGQHESQGRNH